MKHYLFSIGLLLLGTFGPQRAQAQAPAWQSAQAVATATAAATTNLSDVKATAVDAAGNVYVAGNFRNSVVLGSTTLNSAGGDDVFVAKFSPASNQLVWVQQAGGATNDNATALAVSGTSVYVAGYFGIGAASATAVFGPVTLASAGSSDVFVAKLTDAGATSSFAWAQRAGGTGQEFAYALAANGPSVYVAGHFNGVTAGFGPTTLANVLPNVGTFDAFVAKLTDAGATGSFAWAQRAGGMGDDFAYALAVSGTSVCVAGSFANGFGATAAFGSTILTNTGNAFTADVFVAKLTDAGATGSFGWAQRAGGTGNDFAYALAMNGPSVYVAGGYVSPAADFGTTVLTTTGGATNAFVAKLTDAGGTGSFGWAQQAGSVGGFATALAVSGPSVYVAGSFGGSTSLFKLTDAGSAGSFAWTQRSGSGAAARALALSGTGVYVAGYFASPTAVFGSITLSNPNANTSLGFLASLTDPTLTAAAAGRAPAPASLYPNPAHHAATLRLPAGTVSAPLTLTDAQGRAVRCYPAPAGAEAALDLTGLPAGLYLLRGAGPARRLAVE